MMMNEYYEYQKQLEKDFGEKSIVFMMVGSFYETYEFETCGKASEISPLMNIVLTKRNKQKELSTSNPWMCGFPSYCLKKYIDMLVKEHSYTIGIVDQIEDDHEEEILSEKPKKSSKTKKRTLDRIYGPSIPYEYDFIENELDNNIQQVVEKKGLMLCEICFEKQNPVSRQSQYHLSCVIIDLGIGAVKISESSFQAVSDLMRQLKKWWYEFSVVECIQLGSIKYAQIQDDNNEIRLHQMTTPDSKFSLLKFQQKILETIYQIPQDQVIQNLHLERFPVIVKLLVYGFDFLYRQSPLLTRKLSLPIQIERHDGVSLDLHVFYELDILSKTHFRKQTHSSLKEMSLLRIIDKTKTTMGSRLFRQMCFHPISDITELNKRYDNIERHLLDFENLGDIRKKLEFIGDLEIAFRTIQLQKSTPPSITRFLQSICYASEIYPWIKEVYNDAYKLWNIDDLKYGGSFEKSFYILNSIAFPDTTELRKELDKLADKLPGSVVKFDQGNAADAQVYLSKLKYRKLENLISKVRDTIHVDEYKQGYQISTDKINSIKYRIVKQGVEARQELRLLFQKDVHQLFVIEYGHLIEKVIEQLKQLDVETTMASFIKLNGYCRPKLVEEQSSALIAKDMRHPILEFVHTDEKFITNNVSLNDDVSGYLVYGLNSAGKSTLLRATGLCVFLAQIGMYVPCTEFILTPFTRILTKITNMDDMYEKQSTFMFEMSELKHILRYANSQALVLCDELTSGTETLSATGILASSILRCIEKKCRFMMTTHLHTLSEFPEITDNPKLHICHFKVHIDGNAIRYDRKLENGMGDSIYGVEIVNAIGFDDIFVNQAFEFRNRILKTKNIFDNSEKRSRYNRKLIMDQCSECGATENLHTHHIVPQKESDDLGMISNQFHKNKLFNLQILCQSCHQKEHK